MKWVDAFADAMRELEALQHQLARLDDPTVGLTALHGELTQSRLKTLETIQGGVTGLREENREVRRRQDRMITDLNETRGELRQLLGLADALRPLLPAAVEGTKTADDPSAPAERTTPPPEPVGEADHNVPGAAPAHSAVSPSTDSQGGSMDNTGNQAPSAAGGQAQDLALRSAIEAGWSAPTGGAIRTRTCRRTSRRGGRRTTGSCANRWTPWCSSTSCASG
ncbi:hypothetical protein [Streptomyces sp. NPDC056796]|uniref:hypothetical protein n=1 Tax=Streptomyces sp. NPDC056796 TaxID=3345947 RepID=UPI00369C6B70